MSDDAFNRWILIVKYAVIEWSYLVSDSDNTLGHLFSRFRLSENNSNNSLRAHVVADF